MQRAADAVRFASGGPARIAFGVVDGTRNEPDFLLDLNRQAINDGATRDEVVDMVNNLEPITDVREIVKLLA